MGYLPSPGCKVGWAGGSWRKRGRVWQRQALPTPELTAQHRVNTLFTQEPMGVAEGLELD